MKVYLSGPIAGRIDENKPAFLRAATAVRVRGHEAVVPFDIPAYLHEGPCPSGYAVAQGHTSACWLRADLAVLLACDAVLMLVDWEVSVGASLEHQVAALCGIPILYLQSLSLASLPTVSTASDSWMANTGHCLCGFDGKPHTLGTGEWCQAANLFPLPTEVEK